jgi:hypothetical protein
MSGVVLTVGSYGRYMEGTDSTRERVGGLPVRGDGAGPAGNLEITSIPERGTEISNGLSARVTEAIELLSCRT